MSVDPIGDDDSTVILEPSRKRISLNAGQTVLPVKLAVSPLAEQRGQFHTAVVFFRENHEVLRVPIHFQVVSYDQAEGLLVSPRQLHLEASPSSVVQFSLSAKLPHDAVDSEQLQVTGSNVVDGQGQPTRAVTAFEFPRGRKVASGESTAIEGHLIAPPDAGTYHSHLAIATQHSGQVIVPLTLRVH